MTIPLKSLSISTASSGFYAGINRLVAIPAKLIIGSLIIWAVIFPSQANSVLTGLNSFILSNFAAWYIWVMALFALFCLALVLWPKGANDKPEFSNFSWISMMFGAGIGVGMLTWSIAEPLYHLQSSPEVILGRSDAGQENNALNAFKWAYFHWGLSAWACYAIHSRHYSDQGWKAALGISSISLPLSRQFWALPKHLDLASSNL